MRTRRRILHRRLPVDLAGNLLVVGSLAGFLAIKLARDAGVVTLPDHARYGVPITLVAFVLALGWLARTGYARV